MEKKIISARPHEVLEWHEAHLREAAVHWIVAVVTHHEIVSFGDLVDDGIVADSLLNEMKHRICHPVRQRLAITGHMTLAPRGNPDVSPLFARGVS